MTERRLTDLSVATAVPPLAATRSPTHRRHVRSPVDAMRVALGAVLVLLGLALANALDSTLLGLSDDTGANVERLPDWLRNLTAAALASVVISVAAVTAAWSLITTRFRRFALFTAAFAISAALSTVLGRAVYAIVDEPVRQAFDVDVPLFRVGGADGRLSPADPLLAAAIATLTVADSVLSKTLVRRGTIVVAAYALGSVLTIAVPPLALLVDLGIGLMVASALLWTFGRHDLALTKRHISRSLVGAGVQVTDLDRADADRWQATTVENEQLTVMAFSRDDRSADLIFRLFRWLRLRKTGDHRPFVSLRRAVEHEALVWHQAISRGVSAPRVWAVAEAGVDGMIIVRDQVKGTLASEVDHLSDDTLRRLWREAARLQQARIAHGTLNLGSVIVGDHGRPWLVSFERSELSASRQRLGTDVAELLASTAATVGLDRAVNLALESGGRELLTRALPWLQPLALTTTTRDLLADSTDIDDLRLAVTAACDLVPEEPERLERIDTKALFIVATLVLSGWFLVPQLTDLDNIWSQVKGASLSWALAAVAFSVGTYVAATASLLGAIPTRLRFGMALLAQLASSFANRVTPAKVGGVATNIRYFQRHGVPTAVSVTAVGLNAIAGLIMHVVMTLCFLLLASGNDSAHGLQLPSTGAIALGLAAIAGVVAGAVAVSPTRRLLTTHVVPQLRSGWDALQVVIHDPARIALLFGGSGAITLLYMAAMVASLSAFGATASLPVIGLLFLTGSAVANAAPTPGGLGAAEAALIAVFSTVEDAEVVVPAVFLYRLVTFWLPILPGWIALTYLRKTDNI